MGFQNIFLLLAAAEAGLGKKHHHHHHHHHQAEAKEANTTVATEAAIVDKMKDLEKKMDGDTAKAVPVTASAVKQGHLLLSGPLPANFNTLFADAVASATGCDAKTVHVMNVHDVVVSFIQLGVTSGQTVDVVFEAPATVVDAVENEAADASSKLVEGALHSFLVADDAEAPAEAAAPPAASATPEIDTEMPYGELEPFGREDTATELTDNSIKESDEMVDQLERAEVAEEKRSVFRAITRLRGAAITSFDGIARSQTGNIDEYAHTHQWRSTHPLHHLADEESDVSKWAFPDNAD